MDSPLDSALATLGEHYENYVVIVDVDKHNCALSYSNYFAAQGLLSIGKNIIDDSFGSCLNDFEISFKPLEED